MLRAVTVYAVTASRVIDETSDVGPMARHDLRDLLREQRDRALAGGGRGVARAPAPESAPGAWFSPAVVEGDGRDSVILSDETFGPLGALPSGADDDELIGVANSSRSGLSGSAWSADSSHATAVSARTNTGAVFVNMVSVTDPRLPTGGIKASGHGCELGRWGVHELAGFRTSRIRTLKPTYAEQEKP